MEWGAARVKISMVTCQPVAYFISFHFIFFSSRLHIKHLNHPFVVFVYNELRHTHKQEIELEL